MLNNIKIAAKNSIIYSIGNLSSKILGLVLLPIYTDKLTVSEYGILGIVEVSTMLFVSLFSMGLMSALMRWYWDKDYKEKQKEIFFTIFVFLSFVSVLMIFGLISSSEEMAVLLFDKSEYSYLLKLMIVSSGLQIISNIPPVVMQLQERAVLYTSTHIFKLAITLLFTILFIVFKDRKVEGIFEAQIIGFVFHILIMSKFMLKNFIFRFNFDVLKKMLYYSLPLVVSSISGVILSISDRYILKFLGGGLYDVGIYSLGFKMANTLNVFLVASLTIAVTPMMYKMIDHPDNKRFYSKVMKYVSFVVLFAVLAMSIFGMEVIKVFSSSSEYWGAYKIIPIISIGVFFASLKDTSVFGLFICKKTKIVASVIILISVINIILNVILIPYFQIIGAAIATMLSQLIFITILYNRSQKYYHIPFEIKKIGIMLAVCISLILCSSFFNEFNIIIRLIAKTTILISFPFILLLFNFYDEIELIRIKEGWSKWQNPLKWKDNLKNIKIKF